MVIGRKNISMEFDNKYRVVIFFATILESSFHNIINDLSNDGAIKCPKW